MAWVQRGHVMAGVNHTWLHFVNQIGKAHSKTLSGMVNGMGTACYV